MKLNPDCVRDILLFIEANTDLKTPISFKEENVTQYFPQYPHAETLYHLRQCELSGFFEKVSHGYGELFTISYLSPAGHEFIAYLRNDTFFSKVKDVGKELGIDTLKGLTQIAAASAATLIKSHFGLP